MTERINRGEVSLMDARRRLMLAECETGGKSAQHLALAVGRAYETVIPLLRQMRKAGVLCVVGYGHWATWALADHAPELQAEIAVQMLLPRKPKRAAREALDRRNDVRRQQRLDLAAGDDVEDDFARPSVRRIIPAEGAPPLRITAANSVFAWGMAA